jgi:uncharacterized protein (DUF2237 family)
VELDAQFAEDVNVSLDGLIDKLSELQPSGKEVLVIARWVEALSESLKKSIPRRNVWCLCLNRVTSVHDLGIIIHMSIPPCLCNALELHTNDLKLHALCHLRTSTKVCGKTAKPRINIIAIHLARKFW